MKKILLYIFIIIALSSCLEIERPFNASHTVSNNIYKDVYISNIVGFKKKTSDKLKIRINDYLIKNNILSSYKHYNKNNYILSATVIEDKNYNSYKIIWKLIEPNTNKIKKFIIDLNNKNLSSNNHEVLEKISYKISNFIVQNLNNNIHYKTIYINKISGLKNHLIHKNIFIKNIKEVAKIYKIKFKFNEENYNNDYILDIKFLLINLDKNKINFKLEWILKNNNNGIIANIEQNKIISKNIFKNLWPDLSKKIIELAIKDINNLINIEK